MTNAEFNASVNKEIAKMMGAERNESLVEEAAMAYGSAVAMYESARLQRLPESFYLQLRENIADAMDNLKDAAKQHYNDHSECGGA